MTLPEIRRNLVKSGSAATRLFEVQRVSTKMGKDAQLLANRIALLKQEEIRTWKKIDDTKKKTGEILMLKQRNYEKHHLNKNTDEGGNQLRST